MVWLRLCNINFSSKELSEIYWVRLMGEYILS